VAERGDRDRAASGALLCMRGGVGWGRGFGGLAERETGAGCPRPTILARIPSEDGVIREKRRGNGDVWLQARPGRPAGGGIRERGREVCWRSRGKRSCPSLGHTGGVPCRGERVRPRRPGYAVGSCKQVIQEASGEVSREISRRPGLEVAERQGTRGRRVGHGQCARANSVPPEGHRHRGPLGGAPG